MTAVVSLEKVAKHYVRGKQRIEVLHTLDLEVESGEFLALMGPSGLRPGTSSAAPFMPSSSASTIRVSRRGSARPSTRNLRTQRTKR